MSHFIPFDLERFQAGGFDVFTEAESPVDVVAIADVGQPLYSDSCTAGPILAIIKSANFITQQIKVYRANGTSPEANMNLLMLPQTHKGYAVGDGGRGNIDKSYFYDRTPTGLSVCMAENPGKTVYEVEWRVKA
jgi:hypothetical protein